MTKKKQGAAEPKAEEAPKPAAGVSKTVEKQKELARKEQEGKAVRAKKMGAGAEQVRRFRLKRGQHFDARSGTNKMVGGIVKSPLPLDDLEPDRYAAVDQKVAAAGPEDDEESEVTASGAETGVNPTHADEEVNEFPRTKDEEEAEELGVEAAEEEGDEEAEDRDDVTKDYPLAGKSDVKVRKVRGGFNVVDADDLDTPLQGEKPLKDKKAVNAYLKKTYGS